jgi:hypothetical protein
MREFFALVFTSVFPLAAACTPGDDGIFTAAAGSGGGWGGGWGTPAEVGTGAAQPSSASASAGGSGGTSGAGTPASTAASGSGGGGAGGIGGGGGVLAASSSVSSGAVSSSSAGPTAICHDLCEVSAVGYCKGETCVIDCSSSQKPAACSSVLVCPPGLACEMQPYSFAPGGIDCTQAWSCSIFNSFYGPVHCAGTYCFVDCASSGTCGVLVDCQADKCEIVCEATSSCAGHVTCGGIDCSIDCQLPGSCSGGACCTATTCTLAGALNVCP